MLSEVQKIAATCPCGENHKLITDTVVIGRDASSELSAYVGERFRHPLIVCDRNTERYAPALMRRAEVITLDGAVHANEAGIAPVNARLKDQPYDSLIACGSGSVHDITRYCANSAGIAFVSYPTAASVDGFVSTVAAMTFGGQKLSTTAAAPVALFADERVFTEAPARLTASGIGDILGKHTALLDWKIASLLTGEPRCEQICTLMENALTRITALLEQKRTGEIRASSPVYTRAVMEGLVLAGLSMQLQGNSRPASGAEHHLSHLWEMRVINPPEDAYHGEQVGVASLILADYYRRRIDEGFDFTRSIDLPATFDRAHIASAFGDLTDGILDENLSHRDPNTSPLHFTADEKTASLTRDAVQKLIPPDNLRNLLLAAGAPTSLTELSLPNTADFISRSLTFAPYVRKRLTLLKILSAE